MTLEIIILAAGQGKRMLSDRPKVLHKLAGKPLVQHVIETSMLLKPQALRLVVGHGGDQVRQALQQFDLFYALQEQQLGTGHAVAQAIGPVEDDATLLVLYGDVPLTPVSVLENLLELARQDALAILTTCLQNPTGYGRIVRNSTDQVSAIVEEKDATPAQRQIREVNSGIMAMPAARLKSWLPRLSSDNAQGEYYLTDIVALAVDQAVPVKTVLTEQFMDVQGVNDKAQLAQLERYYQSRQSERLMLSGVTLADPARLDVRGELETGRDCYIDINAVFEGQVRLGNSVSIGANCVIKNAVIGDGTQIRAFSHIEDAVIDADCDIGPYARLRPGTDLAQGAKVGNFVEIKKARIGEGSKVNHLSYIGDATLGKDVNVGAGTITCNYDGANKHRTEIGDAVFVGSNTALVAPIKIGKNVTIGAGSTLSKDVEADCLVVARGKERVIKDWKRPVKK